MCIPWLRWYPGAWRCVWGCRLVGVVWEGKRNRVRSIVSTIPQQVRFVETYVGRLRGFACHCAWVRSVTFVFQQ